MSLKGVGVEPMLELSKKQIDFGVVGVGVPEFRVLMVKNPCKVQLRIGVESSDSRFTVELPSK